VALSEASQADSLIEKEEAMSLYNMVMGVNKAAPVVLGVLGITPDQVPRLRDAYYDGRYLCIYTRTGGGNRDYYENEQSCRENYPEMLMPGVDSPKGPWNDDLRAVPGFVTDRDDSYDSTYATFFFEVPEQFRDLFTQENAMTESQQERWEAALNRLRDPDDPTAQRVTAALAPLFDALKGGNDGNQT
jgi:hypothetical protein